MVQIYRDPKTGQEHEFPDDATPQEIEMATSSISYKNKNEESNKALSNFLQPRLPIGLDIASGLMSLIGKSPQQKDIIRNLPYIASNSRPDIASKFFQGIGEETPLLMTGINSVPGLLGTAGRIAGQTGYGAAVQPENRTKGAISGLLASAIGEAIPGTASAIGSFAEKINPVKFAKSKISEMLMNFKNAEQRQKEAYSLSNKYDKEKVLSDPMIRMDYHDPKDFLGFDKSDLSVASKDKYEKFIKNPTFGNLHKLQSQLYEDAKSYKKIDPDSYQKAINARSIVIDRAKQFLQNKDPKALAGYEEGARITREELKPYLETNDLKKIMFQKVKEIQPSKLESVIRGAMEKVNSKIPENHHLRKVLDELQNKLSASELTEAVIPENARKWSPKFAAAVQHKGLLDLLNKANMGYQPLKVGLTGKFLEE